MFPCVRCFSCCSGLVLLVFFAQCFIPFYNVVEPLIPNHDDNMRRKKKKGVRKINLISIRVIILSKSLSPPSPPVSAYLLLLMLFRRHCHSHLLLSNGIPQNCSGRPDCLYLSGHNN